jgi:hypothetical protein
MLGQSEHLEFELGQHYKYPGPLMDDLVKNDLKTRVKGNLDKITPKEVKSAGILKGLIKNKPG